MRIGIIGLGGVGRTLISLLIEKSDELITMGVKPKIVFVLNSSSGCYREEGIDLRELLDHLETSRDLSLLDGGFQGGDIHGLLDLANLDFLIEATPTDKTTGEPALGHILSALGMGVNVVTANKGPVMLYYRRLKDLADTMGVSLGIGCTAGGALPTISSGQYDLLGARVTGIRGVLNGTTNYILTLMEEEGLEYIEALGKAQKEGIAETDPAMDVEGWDTAIKLIIITNALMGSNLKLQDASIEGIQNLKLEDVNKAIAQGKKIKLIGKVQREGNSWNLVAAPEAVDKNDIFFGVNGKNKGIQYLTDTLGEVAVLGGASNLKGAAASLLRDLLQIWSKIK
ncbi:homoserine dehydrogenase [Gudongella oleilytica]|uniref:homoserine dehydrogenase n=1 Tax=Gudongella oleilytica TaxID=1582259 RepID=UPI002A36F14B|nr:homoserine dehydrogenase [Gudongella oleilytica]MDY0255838.1 homoserine dehydrogenase [Gudongella oleilytica]